MTLAQRDLNVIWHPFTPQKNMLPPIPIAKAKGTLLYNENGETYIDAISSWWVNLHGHSHPYIAKKLYEQALQLEQVIFAGFTHEPAVALAERLIGILPNNFAKIFYSDNGSTSVEVALKMALQYWWNKQNINPNENLDKTGIKSKEQRTKIIAFNNAYHGDTFGGMSVSDRSVFTLAFKNFLFDVIFVDTPTLENIEATKAVFKEHNTQTAAFIYEPLVQGAGGLCMYEASLLNQILQVAKSYNIICIADEVMTGFGRTGKTFASEYMHEKPDIICLSKGLTGGTMALGVTACSSTIYEAFLSDNKLATFFHGHSFTANPLACTTALASLDLLLVESCKEAIKNISTNNQAFYDKHKANKRIKNLRVLGTILAFEMNEGEDGYLNTVATTITIKALKHGVYVRPLGNTVYIMPPYCITNQELITVYCFLESLL